MKVLEKLVNLIQLQLQEDLLKNVDDDIDSSGTESDDGGDFSFYKFDISRINIFYFVSHGSRFRLLLSSLLRYFPTFCCAS